MTWSTNTSILADLGTFSAETAWTSLVEHFKQPLTRFARRAGLDDDAVQDVVQETLVAFAAAYRRGAYDPARGRLSHWLFGIARNEVSRARRRAAVDPSIALDTAHADGLAGDDAHEQIWEEEWRRAILERCIERVRGEVEPGTWECFALQTFEGLGAEEVAARLELPRTKVYNAKHRIARRLRELAEQFEDA